MRLYCYSEDAMGGVTLVFETVRAVLAEQLGFEENAIQLRSSLSEDLEAGQSDLEEVMLLLEEEFELAWTEEDLKAFDTVCDLVAFIENQI